MEMEIPWVSRYMGQLWASCPARYLSDAEPGNWSSHAVTWNLRATWEESNVVLHHSFSQLPSRRYSMTISVSLTSTLAHTSGAGLPSADATFVGLCFLRNPRPQHFRDRSTVASIRHGQFDGYPLARNFRKRGWNGKVRIQLLELHRSAVTVQLDLRHEAS